MYSSYAVPFFCLQETRSLHVLFRILKFNYFYYNDLSGIRSFLIYSIRICLSLLLRDHSRLYPTSLSVSGPALCLSSACRVFATTLLPTPNPNNPAEYAFSNPENSRFRFAA